jgi:hypothetical protein
LVSAPPMLALAFNAFGVTEAATWAITGAV